MLRREENGISRQAGQVACDRLMPPGIEPTTLTPDRKSIRCPRLGGPVPFAYCEQAGRDGLPCFKVMDCWWQHFDVAGYLQKHLNAQELRKALERPPQPKITGILERIQQARGNTDPAAGE